ncbi:MAG: extracellular solute-binding protein [Firmicutes bacterium]|nr:extracellular solute-binding protein [Bacillota bacterium]
MRHLVGRIRFLPFCALLGALLSACGGSAATPSHPANSAAPSPSASGTLTVYAALTAQNGQLLAQAFEKAYPQVKVNMVTGGTGLLLSRIAAEQRAGGVRADVVLLADPTAMAGLNQEHLLAAYRPPQAKDLPAGMKGSDWVGAFTFNNVIIYHRGMSLPVPQSWTDLERPIYRDAVEIGNPAYSGTTLGLVGYLSQHYGWQYFNTLKQLGATMVASTNTIGEDVASGRVDVGISLDVVARDLKAKGAPVELVWPKDGAVPVPAPVAIVAHHDSPAARQFEDWLLSAQGQATVEKLGYVPVSGTSTLVPQGTPMAQVNWAAIEQQRNTILQTIHRLFGQ